MKSFKFKISLYNYYNQMTSPSSQYCHIYYSQDKQVSLAAIKSQEW